MKFSSLSCVLLLAGAVLISGCGPDGPRREIHGTVTFDGKPLAAGWIRFESLPEQPTCNESAQILNGAYTVKGLGGLLPGKYKVIITADAANAAPPNENVMPGTPVEEKKAAPTAVQALPSRYNTNSELTAEISATQTEPIDFQLKH